MATFRRNFMGTPNGGTPIMSQLSVQRSIKYHIHVMGGLFVMMYLNQNDEIVPGNFAGQSFSSSDNPSVLESTLNTVQGAVQILGDIQKKYTSAVPGRTKFVLHLTDVDPSSVEYKLLYSTIQSLKEEGYHFSISTFSVEMFEEVSFYENTLDFPVDLINEIHTSPQIVSFEKENEVWVPKSYYPCTTKVQLQLQTEMELPAPVSEQEETTQDLTESTSTQSKETIDSIFE